MHNLISFNELAFSYNNEDKLEEMNDSINDYFQCITECDDTTQSCKRICKELNIELNQVAIVGDDINDLEVMRNVGVSFAPRDAVSVVRKQVDIILEKRGGEGCVRELIDHYLLKHPLER